MVLNNLKMVCTNIVSTNESTVDIKGHCAVSCR